MLNSLKKIQLKNVQCFKLTGIKMALVTKSFAHTMIAVTQMTSTEDKDKNFQTVKKLTAEAAAEGAKVIFFPEGCDYIAESKSQSLDLAEPFEGPSVRKYRDLAKNSNVWLSFGGVHIKNENDSKISNTHILINNFGEIVGKYAKAHLFDVSIPEKGVLLQESKYVQKGPAISNPVRTPCGHVGLGVCYDLRFPEFSLLQRRLGADVLTFPSAFTVPTGVAHWHVLLRARAIETQCYVVASAQIGVHNPKRTSYGHALIVDPWGAVIAESKEGTNYVLAEVDLDKVRKIREEMPILTQRRLDLYSLSSSSHSPEETRLTEMLPFPQDFVQYPFGHVSLPGSTIFLLTSLCLSVVNKKPVVPGHVMVLPQNPTVRLAQMSPGLVSDLAQSVVLTLKILRLKYGSTCVQFAIQDGVDAGQTVKHIHVHLLPVQEPNSGLVERHESNGETEWRHLPAMNEEASDLRRFTGSLLASDRWLEASLVPGPLKLTKIDKEFSVNEQIVKPEQVFFVSEPCFGFVPPNPILPGHVCLTLGDAEASSFADLRPDQVSDVFLSIQAIQRSVEDHVDASSSTIYANDGLHEKFVVHIIPRRDKDFENNDDIYNALRSHKMNQDSNFDQNLQQKLCLNFKKL